MTDEKSETKDEKKRIMEVLVYTTCSNCGTRYIASDGFCPKCGTKKE